MTAVVPVGAPGAEGSYAAHVGRDLLARVPALLPERAETVLVVHTESVREPAETLVTAIRDGGRAAYSVVVPDAEAAKTVEVAAGLWRRCGELDLTRSDAVVGVGGGAVTDLAGFVAATWLRGVALVQVPTSLAGMVDAAIGGKTGINTAEGKNLVGSFHPPVGVVCDVELLRSLPPGELVAGMAEVVKHGFIADPRTLELVEADPVGALDPAGPVLLELVERSVRVKAGVVSEDLRESSLREILNYGHTLGHAIEQVEGYTWRHGPAVAIGLVFAAELGHRAGRTPVALVDRHRSVLAAVGLPTAYPDPGAARWPALLEAMRRDKKSRGALLRFVVLDELARPGRLEGPAPGLLEAAYAAIS